MSRPHRPVVLLEPVNRAVVCLGSPLSRPHRPVILLEPVNRAVVCLGLALSGPHGAEGIVKGMVTDLRGV